MRISWLRLHAVRNITAASVCILMFSIGLRYCWLILTGQTAPVFAGWLVMGTATSLSFLTYYRTHNRNLVSNIGNTIDLMVTWSIVFTAIYVQATQRHLHINFTTDQLLVLQLAGVVVVIWVLTRNAFICNLLLQLLMVIGYTPLLVRAWSWSDTSRLPEPWGVWAVVWTASVLSMIPAYLRHQASDDHPLTWRDTLLPKVYATRATALVSAMLLLLLRLSLRS